MDETTDITSPGESSPVPTASGVRKLAAIMFTDIKDYSKKMGASETATMQMLEIHNRMMAEVVAKHGGTVIKTVGDAFLVSFESVVAATQCAVDVQTGFREYNKEKPAHEVIVIRIGVHVGDIIVKDKDVFGDGVNIAARIQPLATPGGVCISEDAMRQLRGKLDVPLLKLGRGQLKNIDLPVVIYKVLLPWERDSLPAKQRIQFLLQQRRKQVVLGGTAIGLVIVGWFIASMFLFEQSLTDADKSISILPFANVGSPENEFLAVGLTQEITSDLSRIPHLLVVARTGYTAERGMGASDSAVAAEMGTRFVLRGMVQLTDIAIKARAVLYDARRGREVWSESYDQPRGKVRELRGDIVRRIASVMQLDYKAVERKAPSLTPEAYETYLRGLFHMNRINRDDNLLAIEYLSETTRRAPDFAPAYLNLAACQANQFEWGWDQSSHLLDDGERNITRFLQLDSSNPSAYAIYGIVAVLRGKIDEGRALFEQALARDPNNPMALARISLLYLFTLNEPAKAITHLKKLQTVEPNNWWAASNLGIGYAQSKNYGEAMKAFKRALELNPEHEWGWINLAYLHERLAQYDSALTNYLAAIQKNPKNTLAYEGVAYILLSSDRFDKAESVLVDGISHLPNSHELSYLLGVTHGRAGRHDAARRAFAEGIRILERRINRNPSVGDLHAYLGLFNARLGNGGKAREAAARAFELDSTNNDVVIKVARIHALLGEKEKLLYYFEKAKEMNPEYDLAYISTALDFERYRKDPDLVFIARQE